jgi:PAS domain S-box-containing protein
MKMFGSSEIGAFIHVDPVKENDMFRHLRLWAFGGLFALAGLLILSRYNYILFHTVAELGAATVAWSAFIIVWNARHLKVPEGFLMLGVGYALISSVDFLHALAYSGMDLLPIKGTNLATQLWISMKYVEATALLLFPLSFVSAKSAKGGIIGLPVMAVSLLSGIFIWDIFPECYNPQTGLTLFKKISEYTVMGMTGIAGILIWQKRALIGKNVSLLLTGSVVVTILSEFSFTLYDSPFGFANMVGHLLKVTSFMFVYRAVISEGLERPLETLGHGLQQEVERNLSILETATDGFWLVDMTGRICKANEAAVQLLGYSRDELRDKRVGEMVSTEVAGETETVMRMISAKRKHRFETHLRHRNGTILDVEVSASYLPGEERIAGFFRDISDRKRIEKETAQLHRELAHRERILKSITDVAGRLLEMTTWDGIEGALCQIGESAGVQRAYIFENQIDSAGQFQISMRHEWVQSGVVARKGASNFQNVSYESAGFNSWHQKLSAGQSVAATVRLLTPSQRSFLSGIGVRAIALMPIHVGGNWWGAIGFDDCLIERQWHDSELDALQAAANLFSTFISKLAANHALVEREARYNAIVNDQTELICRFAADGVLSFVNGAYCRYFGYTAEDLIGRSFFRFIPDEEHELIRNRLRTLSGDRPIQIVEHQVFDPNGGIRWMEWMDRALFNDSGEIVDYQSVGRDITERKELQKNLMDAAERVQITLGQELHDGLCQDLKGLEIQAALLEDRVSGIDAVAKYLSASLAGSINLAVRKAYAIAHGMIPPIDAIGFSAALSLLAAKMQSDSGIQVVASINENQSPATHEQAYHLYRIAQEAMSNALRHSGATRIELKWYSENECMMLMICDNGTGFDNETTSPPSGLGLIVMRSRAQAIGAYLMVQGWVGNGTTVTVRLN